MSRQSDKDEIGAVLARVQNDTDGEFEARDMDAVNPAVDTWVEVADKLRVLVVVMAGELSFMCKR